ncbi:ZYBA0S18-00122g1_1 [Zygosaccharomyces bailii CLIB 213]|uniref:ZYBA0S18-00122g1_1 n=1 Tax=Zygosaccharomyces bailii (strain CLIB 213 / ATCC 58445 / CBS 680 / BCRC 21525 / NBRC 1098 / NCYC 1416 / NRRL Y-2227) TaxID=1333698 RepID=A0A8J2TBZ6_ZYGB2|nr:ZYBA0S18-00122g1_1 [Zygosaccharomyces bailii CLIB 213]
MGMNSAYQRADQPGNVHGQGLPSGGLPYGQLPAQLPVQLPMPQRVMGQGEPGQPGPPSAPAQQGQLVAHAQHVQHVQHGHSAHGPYAPRASQVSHVHASPQPYQYPGFQLFPSPLPLRQFSSTPSRLSPTSGTSVLSPAAYGPNTSATAAGGASTAPCSTSPPIPSVPVSTTAVSIPASMTGPMPGSAPAAPPVHSYDVRGSIISYDHNGNVTKPRVTTTMWEDEKTLCYQVEANGISVVRRADNDMINGTKLLNVAKITRGRRDGILKAERVRHVVKIGSMHLKGVWIPFERAHAMAQREKIVDHLYPLFVKNIQSVLRETGEETNSPVEAQIQPAQAPVPAPAPAPAPAPPHVDPWYRSASTILPQPYGGSVRTTPQFAMPLTPYRPLPSGGPGSGAGTVPNATPAGAPGAPNFTDYARPVLSTSIHEAPAPIQPLVPAPQPHHMQHNSQLLRPASSTTDTTERSASDSDSSRAASRGAGGGGARTTGASSNDYGH